MRTLVVGAGGYLGGVILDKLVQEGHDVVGCFRRDPGTAYRIASEGAKRVYLDATETSFADEVLSLLPDVIVYCVSLDHFDSEVSVEHSLRVNVAPLAELARKIASARPSCPIIYLSTLQVYGPLAEGSLIDERTPTNPQNIYAATHLFCENLLEMYAKTGDLASVSLRLSNSFGPPAFSESSFDWLVINDFCRSAVRDQEIVLKSDGLASRDFIFIDDVASAVERLCAAADTFQQCTTLNLAAGKSMSLWDAATAVGRIASRLWGAEVKITKPKSGQDKTQNGKEPFEISTHSLREVIGDLELHKFEAGVGLSLLHFRQMV